MSTLDQIRAALPAWATAKVYYSVSCSSCGTSHDNEDYGTILFDDVDAARRDAEEADWVLDRDRLLCGRCAAKEACALAGGHEWVRGEYVRHDSGERLAYWTCSRCDTLTHTDPSGSTDRQLLDVQAPRPVSPDCAYGKCKACSGNAWNHATDEPARCEHACHGGAE